MSSLLRKPRKYWYQVQSLTAYYMKHKHRFALGRRNICRECGELITSWEDLMMQNFETTLRKIQLSNFAFKEMVKEFKQLENESL